MDRKEKIYSVAKNRQSGIVVVLEDVHDPHNAAAILRSCDAFGVQDVYFIFDKQKPYNPARVGKVSSSSANKWLSYKRFSSASECASELKRDGFTTFATILDKEARSIFKTKFSKHKKIAIFFGNEKDGLSPEAIRCCDKKVYIPMRGLVQSLNVSVTAALFIFEATRQRGSSSRFKRKKSDVDALFDDLSSR
ncbi:MAG: RNA methyltransferase [Candidatus Paceibacterota bacterium]